MVVGFIEEFNTPKSIIEQIKDYADRYGEEVLTWPVYLEQCSQTDAEYKRKEQDWDIIKVKDNSVAYPDYPEDEYFRMLGGVGINIKKKYIILSVNY